MNAAETSRLHVDRDNPFLGLASFEEAHSTWFHGRESEREELIRLVRRDLLTVLFGLSGLGKTSLLNAGVFPCCGRTASCPSASAWPTVRTPPRSPSRCSGRSPRPSPSTVSTPDHPPARHCGSTSTPTPSGIAAAAC